MRESEAFKCKVLKGETIVHYAEPLITQQMKAFVTSVLKLTVHCGENMKKKCRDYRDYAISMF